jgi:hypothetical protein
MTGPREGHLYYSDRPVMAFATKPKIEDIDLVLLPLEYTWNELVGMRTGGAYDADRPSGYIYTNKLGEDLKLYATEPGWGGYYEELDQARKGLAEIHDGFFNPEEMKYGHFFAHNYSRRGKEGLVQVEKDWKWLYPAISYKGETFPLIWIPWEKKDDSAA